MELVRALAALTERPCVETVRLARLLGVPATPDVATWTDVFGFTHYPYASVHLGDEGMLGGDARDRVAGFVRALEAVPPPEPDRLATLLAMYAELRERGDDGERRAAHAATSLLHEHLVSWLPLYLARVAALAPEPYRSWAELTTEVLLAEVAAHPLGTIDPGDDPGDADGDADGDVGDPALLPAALRDAAVLVDPRSDPDDPALTLPSQLLVPARTGTVLTLPDLRRAARETRLGMRVGERRYVLEQLFAQSVPTTLRWIADHAVRTTAAAVAPWDAALPVVSGWWRHRSETTARLLRELADEADAASVVVVA